MDHLGAAIGPVLATLFLLRWPNHLRTLFLLTIIPGVLLAVLLYRTDLPAARHFRALIGICMFVPLPLFALAWQSVGGGGWRPWTQGLLFAAQGRAALG